ncbi:hypothetical protein RND71_038137 [Anisodus tanguticus]|uniref:Sof1-like protein domain-containing protein n=1 Tax=Anisodus tanguticus TaxID=243964 RepID=A0AAE1QZG9_9SOLA|nr:hypothetical protein RND71_038137 [Anisodus tanguticus]
MDKPGLRAGPLDEKAFCSVKLLPAIRTDCSASYCVVFDLSYSDHSISICDLRLSTPARKVIMMVEGLSACIIQGLESHMANDDGKCYSYDVRKLNEAKCVHEDHVSSVIDIDYSPTGREFVTGSYDRSVGKRITLRGWRGFTPYLDKEASFLFYYWVFCVKFSCDASYIISGSDDTNLRLWKAKASEQLGVILPRERKRHEHLSEINRIVRHMHLPKSIYKATKQICEMTESERGREERRKAHSAPGSIQNKSLRKLRISELVE